MRLLRQRLVVQGAHPRREGREQLAPLDLGITAPFLYLEPMSQVPKQSMNVDEFLAWAEQEEGRYELYHGQVYAMAPERSAHALAKFTVQSALAEGIRQADLPCTMYPDGMTVRYLTRRRMSRTRLCIAARRSPAMPLRCPTRCRGLVSVHPEDRRLGETQGLFQPAQRPPLPHRGPRQTAPNPSQTPGRWHDPYAAHFRGHSTPRSTRVRDCGRPAVYLSTLTTKSSASLADPPAKLLVRPLVHVRLKVREHPRERDRY